MSSKNSWACWSCKEQVTMTQRADADGACPHCGAELDIESWPYPDADPVVERQLEPIAMQWQYEAGSEWWAFDAENVGDNIASGTKIRLTDHAGNILFKYPAPELAELQAIIAQQKKLLSDQELNAAALCRKLQSQKTEIERLKGGQGELAAPKDLLHRLAYAISQVGKLDQDIDYDAVILAREDLSAFRATMKEPPTPVAVVLPERMVIPEPKSNLSDMDMFDYEVGFNACLDKVKELNQ